MGLGKFFKHKDIANSIAAPLESMVARYSQIMVETSKLMQLHVLRLLDEGKPLPKMNNTFFYRGIQLVSTSSFRDHKEENAGEEEDEDIACEEANAGDEEEENAGEEEDEDIACELQTTFTRLYAPQRPKEVPYASRELISKALVYGGENFWRSYLR